MSFDSLSDGHSPQLFRLRTQSTLDEGPPPISREGFAPKQGGSKGKVIGVFTSGGDSQGTFDIDLTFLQIALKFIVGKILLNKL